MNRTIRSLLTVILAVPLFAGPLNAHAEELFEYWHSYDLQTKHPNKAAAIADLKTRDSETALMVLEKSAVRVSADAIHDLFAIPDVGPETGDWSYRRVNQQDPPLSSEAEAIQLWIDLGTIDPECPVATWAPNPAVQNGQWFETDWYFGEPTQWDAATEYRKDGILTWYRWSTTALQCSEHSAAGATLMRTRDAACPAEYQQYGGIDPGCKNNRAAEVSQRTVPSCEITRGENPCGVSSGAKYVNRIDYSGPGIQFKRSYNSKRAIDGLGSLGAGWSYSYESRLVLGSSVYVGVIDDNGSAEVLNRLVPDVFVSNRGTGKTLIENSSTNEWELSLSGGTTRIYDNSGALKAIRAANGQVTSISRDSEGRVDFVTGPFGHSLDYVYDSEGLLQEVVEPSGNSISFTYKVSAVSNVTLLDYVTFQDGTTEQYVYEKTDAARDALITGVIDENQDRETTYDYDLNSLVIQSEHGNGKKKVSLAYTAATTTVTDEGGSTTVYTFETASGKPRQLLTRTEDGATKSHVYPSTSVDKRQRPSEITDERGFVTKMLYPDEITSVQTEAFGTSLARETTYEYLNAESRLPTRITSPSVYAGANRIVDIAYGGDLLPDSVAISGFKSDGVAVSRSISMTYTADGQIRTVDGAIPGNSDLATYDYYECTTGNECGKLAKITNAVGHETLFDDYDAHGRLLQMTDSNGLEISFTYDLRGRMLTTTQTPTSGTARVTTNTYYPSGLLETVTTPDGLVVSYYYDTAHEVDYIEDNLGNRMDYDYDDRGNQTDEDVYDALGVLKRTADYGFDLKNRLDDINVGNTANSTSLAYDSLGNLEAETDPELALTQHSYDALNRLDFSTDAMSGAIDYDYDARDNLTLVTAANGAQTTYEYDDLGNLGKETSADRGTILYTHDEAGNLKTKTDARGKVTSYDYDSLYRLELVTHDDLSTIAYEYDTGVNASGRLNKITDSTGTTEWNFDNFGAVTQKTQTVGSIALTTGYEYDSAGRLFEQTLPSGKVVTFGYNTYLPTSVTVDGTPILSAATYDPFGPVNGWTWGNGSLSSRNYDLRGLATSVEIAGDTQVLGHDLAGQVTSQQETLFDVTYDYDLLGRLTDFTNNNVGGGSPPGPMFSASPVILASIQTANNEAGTPPAGNPTPWITTAVRNVTASSVQLALGRAEVNSGSISTAESIGYIAIEGGANGSFSANGSTVDYEAQTTSDSIRGWQNGCYLTNFFSTFASSPTVVATINRLDGGDGGWARRCSLSNAAIGLTIDEDQFRDTERRHTTEKVGFAAFSQDFSAVFTDTVGTWGMEAASTTLAATTSDPTFKQVTFQQAYATPPVVVVLATNETPDPAAIRIRNVTTTGFEAAQVEPANADGLQGAMTLHYLAVESGTHELPDGTRILAATVSTQSQQHGSGVSGAESWHTESFAEWPGSVASPLPNSQAFDYDGNGNRTLLTENATPFLYSSLAGSNRLLSTAGPQAKSYSYDLAGNITGDGVHTYGYDDRGRFINLDSGTVTYSHNGQGQRVTKNNGTTVLFAYDEAGNLIGEYDASGNVVQEHVWFNSAPVAVLEGANKHYVHTDHLGTPRAVSDGNTVIWRWESDPFGSTTANEDPDGNSTAFTYNLRFPGQYYDVESALHYNYYRTYDPSTGRYLESDPIGLGGGLNTYGYVGGNPLSAFDPFGLDLVLVGEGGPLGSQLDLAAKTWDEENCGCNEIKKVSTGEEALAAMKAYAKKNGSIDNLRVFAHSGVNGIYFSQAMWRGSLYSHGPANWLSPFSPAAARMQSIDPKWFDSDAMIDLRGCKAAKGENSFAQQLADHLNLPVLASPVGTQFTGVPGGKPGQDLPDPVPQGYTPIYMVPDGGADFVTIQPSK
jgi:RHS repeat-associated protein